MKIEKYGFDKDGLVAATAVNSYLKGLTPEARTTTLAEVVKKNGTETMVNGEKLITLIDAAKAAAMIGSEAWRDGDGIYQKTLDFIRATLPTVDGRKYVANEQFLRFIQDWATEAQL